MKPSIRIALLFLAACLATPAAADTVPTLSSTWGTHGTGPGELNGASNLERGGQGEWLIADRLNSRVEVFYSPSGPVFIPFDPDATVGSLLHPSGVSSRRCYAASPNDLWVADTDHHRVVRYDANYLSIPIGVEVLGSAGTALGQFNHPVDVVENLIAPQFLYILDQGNNRVQIFNRATHVFVSSFGSAGTGAGQFNAPSAMCASDVDGTLYISDTGNDRIQVFTSTGFFVRQWGSHGSGPGQFDRPRGLAVDLQGRVYVADAGNHRVQVFDASGNYLYQMGAAGTGPGQFVEAADVAVQGGSQVYLPAVVSVLDEGADRIEVFDPPQTIWPGNSTLPTSVDLQPLTGGVVDPAGAFTVVLRDFNNNPIANEPVTISLGACADLRIGATQTHPGMTWDCGSNSVRAVTNSAGEVSFDIAGHVGDRTVTPSSGGCATIRAAFGNTLLGNVSVSAMDEDGLNGRGAADLSYWYDDFANGPPNRGRSDFDHNGQINPGDLGAMVGPLFSSPPSTTPGHCAGGPASTPVVAGNSGGLLLAWNDCRVLGDPAAGLGGNASTLRSFACASNAGTDQLVASMIPPQNMPSNVIAFEATIEVRTGAGTTLPSWWQMQPGGCRSTSLTGGVDLSNITPGCGGGYPLFNGSGILLARMSYSPATPDRALIRVFGAQNSNMSINVLPGEESYLFDVRINHQRTTGTTVCAGCSQPMHFTFNSLRLVPPTVCGSGACGDPDVLLTQAATPGSNTVDFQSVPFVLQNVSPTQGASPDLVTLTVHGTGINANASLRLRRTGFTDLVGIAPLGSLDGTSLSAQFDLTFAADGYWDVVVTSPGSTTAILPAAFHVIAPLEPHVVASLQGANTFRSGRTGSTTVRAYDAGSLPWNGVAMFALYAPADLGPVQVNYAGAALGSFTPTMVSGRPLVGLFNLPHLAPFVFNEKYVVKYTPPLSFACGDLTLEAFQVAPSLAGPPAVPNAPGAVAAAMIDRVGVALGHGWPVVSAPFSDALAAQLAIEISIRLDAFAANPAANLAVASHAELVRLSLEAALGALAGSYAADVAAYRTVWNVMSAGAEWSTAQTLMPGAYAALASPPAPLADFPAVPVTKTLCFLASFDPNDKSGPSGSGAQHAVPPGTPFSYLIHFENQATAALPAQTVSVTDTLDGTRLNLATFSLGTVTVGTHSITPAPGLASWTGDLDLRPDVDMIARITANLDPYSGVATWYFDSIDPATGLPTENPLAGFLPPNATPPIGEGSVSFDIEHRPAIADGDVISNKARIVFDVNPYLDTPLWSNLIDASAPASTVSSLAPQPGQPAIVAQWSGTDAGAGIADYSVYVSADGGPWTAWLKNTSATSATYTGQFGHSYGFYSVARDRAGHVEAAPAAADATVSLTTGVPGAPEVVAFALEGVRPNPSPGALSVSFALPHAGKATLDLIDVAGRRVESREVGSLGAGRHVVRFEAGSQLPAGVYLVRLTQNGRSLHARAAIVH